MDDWNHGDYVEDSGAGLCVICHSAEVDGPQLLGPRCLSCHRDIQAFRVSLVESQVGKGRDLVADVQESAKVEYSRSQNRPIDFFDVGVWNHADYVEDNGEVLCVICHSLEAGGPTMRGRGPRCMSCHLDTQAFADGIRHRRQVLPEQ